MKIIISIIILIILVLFVVSLSNSEKWLPIYYPNYLDLTIWTTGPIFNTLDQCRVWIYAEADKREQLMGVYDYECGLNCKLDDTYGLFICEETLK